MRPFNENNETIPGPPRPFIKVSTHCGYAKYWWFRIAGYGLHFRCTRDGYTPLFSERNGHVKVLKLGRLWVKVLRPDTY
jgi:hypothetical protein